MFGKKKRKIANNPWREHIKETQRKNPGMALKEILKEASRTYVKPKKECK
jgi:hypothetical protein